ncbi:hypothetical protein GF324_03160, partial [bacterium]|nr:hypothetical protein [bacterium]
YTAGLLLQHGPLDLFFGRDRVRWGPGRTANLLFSGESSPFTHMRLGVDIGERIRLSFLAGDLEPYPELRDSLYTTERGYIRTVRREKHIAAHRFEFVPLRWLRIGLQEAVVYGERATDWGYLNPVSVYFSEEHENGNQDNNFLGGDLLLTPVTGASFWISVLIDDMTFGRLGDSFYRNKYAWLIGAELLGPGGLLPESALVEYTRIRPYMYSHFYPINTFKHWNAPLGLQLEPNSDRVAAQVIWRPAPARLRFGTEAYYLRHGANYVDDDGNLVDVGGEIDTGPARNRVSEKAVFLDGKREETLQVHGRVMYDLLEHFTLYAAVGYTEETHGPRDGLFAALGFAWRMPEDRRSALRR